ncbi:MAG TPA: hypothetical protein VJ953_01715 [Saprospiraceae bacterium]|nr:hypothetical protein [Saprospiraceae bacterium]
MPFLKKIAAWPIIFVLFVIYLGFSLWLFPYYQSQIDDLAGEPLTALDLRMQYSPGEVKDLMAQMGKEGRAINRFISGRIDMIYPLVYGLFLILLLVRLSSTLKYHRGPWLLLVPILAMLFDYLENFQVLRMLRQYPDISEELVAFSSLMSSLKWLFVLAALLLVVILGILQGSIFIRNKRAQGKRKSQD